jgi:hypothetical protein
MNCPECNKEILDIVVREPIQVTLTGADSITMSATTYTGPSYSPTSKTFKCSNPKCWVTKVKISWE